ncbi:MAG: type II secretion system protein [Patescibacteria group bacterium]
MKKRGFTLIEIMTAVSVFAIVTTISMGSILTVFDVNRKSESIKTVMDNLNLSVESMAREMRFGTNYVCSPPSSFSSIPSPAICPAGGISVAFLDNLNAMVIYRKNGSTIEKSRDGGSNYISVTAPEITINDLQFYVFGALKEAGGSQRQPKVIIKIKGTAGTKQGTQTDFTVQTMVSQRQLDL